MLLLCNVLLFPELSPFCIFAVSNVMNKELVLCVSVIVRVMFVQNSILKNKDNEVTVLDILNSVLHVCI